LVIGERATLTPHPELRAYGTIMDLSSGELDKLYESAGVEGYESKTVQINPMAGVPVEAVTYILPIEMVSGKNSEYATKLAEIAKKLNFPDHYIKEIRSWI
jgi:hypothetical protein